MGRRSKFGYQSASKAGIRNKTLKRLIELNIALMDETLNGSEPLPLMKELYRRYNADMDDASRREGHEINRLNIHNRGTCSQMIVDYLNTDDIMKVLNCSRRTAVDYLQTIRWIHVFTSFMGTTAVLAGRV